MQQLTQTSSQLFMQIENALQLITDEQYSFKNSLMSNATIGQHVRRGGMGLQRLGAFPFLDHHEGVGAEFGLDRPHARVNPRGRGDLRGHSSLPARCWCPSNASPKNGIAHVADHR